jgi:hypothetical protein
MHLSKEQIISIENAIAEGYVNKTKHPEFDLYNLNYTNKCQIDWRWNEATKLCRGLIVDGDYNVRARSYHKFFTIDQIEDSNCDVMPPEDIEYIIAHKKDGFLGILYFGDDGLPYISSRGSFTSDMALNATKMLRTKYKDCEWNSKYSYVFEIIYPNSILTLHYGYEALVLHGMYDNETGKELWIHYSADVKNHVEKLEANGLKIEWPVEYGSNFKGIENFYKKYKFNDDEGYVISFANGYKVKVKFDEYKKMSQAKRAVGAPGSRSFLDKVASGEIEEAFKNNPFLETPERRIDVDAVYYEYEGIYTHEVLEPMKKIISDHNCKNIKDFALVVYAEADPMYRSALINAYLGKFDRMENAIWKVVKRTMKRDIDE